MPVFGIKKGLPVPEGLFVVLLSFTNDLPISGTRNNKS